MNRVFVFSLIFIGLAFAKVSSAAVYIPLASTLEEGRFRFFSDSTYSISQTRWDSEGQEVPFEEGEEFHRFQSEAAIAYGLSDWLQFKLGARYRLNMATALDNSNSQYVSLSNGGLESLMAQVTFSKFFNQKYYLALEAKWRSPRYSNENFDSSDPYRDLVLGDAQSELSFGLKGSYLWSSSALSFGLRYRNPGEQLSNEMVTLGELAFFGDSLGLVLGLESVLSLESDEYTDDPANKPDIARASTYLYNSVNRSWNDAYVKLQIAMSDKWRMDIGLRNRLSGSSTDALMSGLVNFTYTSSPPKKKKKLKDSKFKNYEVNGDIEKVSPKESFVIVDVGLSQGVRKGMDADIYKDDYFGSSTLLASGIVYQVKGDSAIIKITKRYRRVKLEKGMVVRMGSI